ncbi:hypothetical protein E4K64_03285 [Bradyrhizobium frederickii]|uniref:Uncharacterized protein n=1 Tax=Bradyrhizobium frederickii TaxID=2560054 RepID=A0A4Y9PHR0_9BRAD|nr:hypothetical protein [Bradyrhizobium frederickii]TFV79690.1 hypothetical protein E4K64_03285 [Bradyrhizobium frederickii]
MRLARERHAKRVVDLKIRRMIKSYPLEIRGYLYAAIRWSRTPDAAAGDERNRFACDGAWRGDPISRPINPLGRYEAPQFEVTYGSAGLSHIRSRKTHQRSQSIADISKAQPSLSRDS